MELQILNRFGEVRCVCKDISCFPTTSEINSMAKGEYSFMLNGKKISVKKLKELVKSKVTECKE